jgi:hypothetical protein
VLITRAVKVGPYCVEQLASKPIARMANKGLLYFMVFLQVWWNTGLTSNRRDSAHDAEAS